MAVQWSDELAVGVGAIDEQHKGIFSRINNLLNAMAQGKGRDEVGKVITFLADYVVKHFKAEEEIMAKHNYDGISSQKTEHAQFIRDFSALKMDFEKNGVTTHLVLQVQNKLCNWLKNHIGSEDKKIGDFLKKCA